MGQLHERMLEDLLFNREIIFPKLTKDLGELSAAEKIILNVEDDNGRTDKSNSSTV